MTCSNYILKLAQSVADYSCNLQRRLAALFAHPVKGAFERALSRCWDRCSRRRVASALRGLRQGRFGRHSPVKCGGLWLLLRRRPLLGRGRVLGQIEETTRFRFGAFEDFRDWWERRSTGDCLRINGGCFLSREVGYVLRIGARFNQSIANFRDC